MQTASLAVGDRAIPASPGSGQTSWSVPRIRLSLWGGWVEMKTGGLMGGAALVQAFGLWVNENLVNINTLHSNKETH